MTANCPCCRGEWPDTRGVDDQWDEYEPDNHEVTDVGLSPAWEWGGMSERVGGGVVRLIDLESGEGSLSDAGADEELEGDIE